MPVTQGRGEEEGRARHLDPRRAYRDGIARVLRRPADSIELLAPQETADLLERHEVRMKATGGRPAGSRSFAMTARDPAVIDSLLRWLAVRFPTRALVLFRAGSREHGAVCTSSAELLPSAMELVVQDGGDLLAVGRDGAFGITLEVVADWQAEPGERFYKLVAWGVPE
jgi:hypothetical protein